MDFMADEKVKDGFFASSVHRLRANPWIITTFFLVIALFVVLVLRIPASSNGGLSGNVVSQEVATSNLLTFIKAQAGEDAKLVSVAKDNNFYDITVNFQGQDVPVLVTLDGQFLVAQAIPLNATKPSANATQQQAAPANVTKSDKPKVQAFIFSYCPYGLQFEKALIPAYDLLKTTADIDIVAIGAMHGEFEHVESLRQLCIEKNYGRDKLFSYLKAFDENSDIGSCSGTDSCVNPLIEKIYTTLGIDKAKIATCMEKDAPALYDAQGNLSQSLGVSGSPTFVINGAQVQVSRTPEAIKTAICDAYTTAPSVCNQTLSSSAMTPGFGASAGTSTGSSCG
jgi:hypothetical protein